MSMWSEPYFDLPNLEQQLYQYVAGPATNFDTAISLTSEPTPLAVTTIDAVNPRVTNYGNLSGIIAAPK
jgi:hypothetical protein